MSEHKAKIALKDDLLPMEDKLENLVSGIGGGNDKAAYSRFTKNQALLMSAANKGELNALYREDWVSAKIVDLIPEDMTREWRYFAGDITPEQVEQLEEEEKRLNLRNKFKQAHKWARLYGTSLIVIDVDDGQLVDKPLIIDKIRPGSLRFINVVDRHMINGNTITPIMDPTKAAYGMPEHYSFTHAPGVKIHHTRVLRFDAVELPFLEFQENNYFSDSVLLRVYKAISDFATSTSASASMIHDNNVDVIRIKGLMNYLQNDTSEAMLRKRFNLAYLFKSLNNCLLLDTDEDYDTKAATFAGIHDLIQTFQQIISGAADIPATRMFGMSASGLNATGEGDLKNYYDKIRSLQSCEYRPNLDYFDQIMAMNLGFNFDADLSYEFNSLFQLTEKDKADLEKVRADRDILYLDRGVITEAMIAKDLQQNGTYTNISDEHIEELEQYASESETEPAPEPDELEPPEDDPDGNLPYTNGTKTSAE